MFGFYPEGLAAFTQMSKNAPMLADSIKKSPLATMYPKTNWETSFKKMGELASTPYDWSAQVVGQFRQTDPLPVSASSVPARREAGL
jgi:hypothetical protein